MEVQEEDQAADRVKFHQTPIVTIAEKQVTSPGIAQRRKKTERRRESKEKKIFQKFVDLRFSKFVPSLV